jgi:hypothetical protein
MRYVLAWCLAKHRDFIMVNITSSYALLAKNVHWYLFISVLKKQFLVAFLGGRRGDFGISMLKRSSRRDNYETLPRSFLVGVINKTKQHETW